MREYHISFLQFYLGVDLFLTFFALLKKKHIKIAGIQCLVSRNKQLLSSRDSPLEGFSLPFLLVQVCKFLQTLFIILVVFSVSSTQIYIPIPFFFNQSVKKRVYLENDIYPNCFIVLLRVGKHFWLQFSFMTFSFIVCFICIISSRQDIRSNTKIIFFGSIIFSV